MLFLIFAAAVLTSLILTPLIAMAAEKYGLYDEPGKSRRIHTRPVPRLGGAAIFASVFLTLLTARVTGVLTPGTAGDRFLTVILVGGGVMFVLGLVDDLTDLRPSVKLAVQVVVAVLVYTLGTRVEILSLGPQLEVQLGWLSLPLSVIWVVGVTNAFNLIDGLDGLATGIGIVALGTILIAAYVLQNLAVVVIAIALIGSLLGFLRYNFSPARIFLGDSGSLFVGFMLAVLSVYGSLKSATALLVVVPLFALAVPLLDVAFTISRRWLRGVPVSAADARHIHHRLLDLGFGHGRAAVTLYVIAAGLAMLGISVAFAPPLLVSKISLIGGISALGLFLYGIRKLDYREFAEAGNVIGSGFLRVRRVIRDQIVAQELSSRVLQTGSLQEMGEVLRQAAGDFGFLAIQLCREESREVPELGARPGRRWKIDFPIEGDGCEVEDLVLRVWCHTGAGNRPYGAERVARIVAPAICRRMGELETMRSTADAAIAPAGGGRGEAPAAALHGRADRSQERSASSGKRLLGT